MDCGQRIPRRVRFVPGEAPVCLSSHDIYLLLAFDPQFLDGF